MIQNGKICRQVHDLDFDLLDRINWSKMGSNALLNKKRGSRSGLTNSRLSIYKGDYTT